MKSAVKSMSCFLICILLFGGALAFSVRADMGPKPSVRVNFEGMGDELCYGTLLSKNPSTGPYSVWDGDEAHVGYYKESDEEIWRAFTEYEDADGYYFLQIFWEVSNTEKLEWTYYPPSNFKILLYYPGSDTFAVSGIYEKYAFDTYYTVDMSGEEIGAVDYDAEASGNERLIAYKSYMWRQEFFSFVMRVVITIAIEMGVALLFGFREKKAFKALAILNTVTQILLNVFLNLADFKTNGSQFALTYIILELAVFLTEALFCSVFMNRYCSKRRNAGFYTFYSFAANAVSFGVGLAFSNVIPMLF